MKAYFVASVALSEKFGQGFKEIAKILIGVPDLSLINHPILSKGLEDIKKETDEEKRVFYKKVLRWIKTCDVVIAEVSFPSSINIGHEITLAMEFEKPVLALYIKGNSPIFLEGYSSEKFILAEYDPSDPHALEKTVKLSIKKLMQAVDIRFNFFVSPKISTYLDWVSKEKRVPRSVYLRRLIEEDMNRDKDYNEGDK